MEECDLLTPLAGCSGLGRDLQVGRISVEKSNSMEDCGLSCSAGGSLAIESSYFSA
jgi:hypothetical protein